MLTWPIESPPCCSNRRCLRPAECDIDSEPWCLDCADRLLGRFAAVSLVPELRELLPELFP